MADDIKQQEEYEENDELMVLVDDNGEEVEFHHIATLDYKDDWYIYLQPVELGEMEEDEMLIFKIEADEEGNDVFMPVEDEDLLNKLYEEYLKECDLQEGDK
ncbi:MAG: DUF1292 domain-containing protein [Clostridia bacterium]|nr:DUF1292 domain-containing protein [Clostridia bacterium]MDE7328765.1 DUF1292 domain-containing protein [Clostridia bacterium]